MKFLMRYLIVLILIITTLIYFYYQNNNSDVKLNLTKSLLPNQIEFDIDKNVLIFFHIQKTSGREFDRFLVENLIYNDSYKTCEMYNGSKKLWVKIKQNNGFFKNFKQTKVYKDFYCKNIKKQKIESSPMWYWGMITTDWLCGVHPDLYYLKECISNYYSNLKDDGFYYFTMIREPINRYISEWKHVSNGGYWVTKYEDKFCIFKNHYQFCQNGKRKSINITLEKFISCKYNLANNRQTRMLASKTYDCVKLNDDELLEEAKQNLESLAFFGLTEYQNYTQQLFLKTFVKNFKFTNVIQQSEKTEASSFLHNKSESYSHIIEQIKRLNNLDIELYKYAHDLFFKRLKLYEIIK